MIKVLRAGVYMSVQDLGRTGVSAIGIPSSGVMDKYAAKFANTLLGNNENDAVIEITFGGSKLEFLTSCTICISGADFSAKINDESVPLHTVLFVEKGSILSFGKRNFGVRTYVAILGGFLTEKILGSRSFSKDITNQTILKKGDCISVPEIQKTKNNTYSKVKFNSKYFKTNIIEVYKGPEFDLLSDEQKKHLKKGFTISSSNSRMGYILNEKVENNLSSMFSSGVLPGTVQLTPSGKLIVLMRDCQVTGGYPRIFQLSENAIDILSQKITGEYIHFKDIS